MDMFVEMQLDNGMIFTAAYDDTLSVKQGDICVYRKDFYQDIARVIRLCGDSQPKKDENETSNEGGNDEYHTRRSSEFPRVVRKAAEEDKKNADNYKNQYASVFKTTHGHIQHLKLPMKLINVHYSMDGKIIIIQFSANGRVDFRELVKVLSSEFGTRIELRQIGVRDETSVIGGISVCGRPLCCCRFLHDFASINVKMAKEQDLSLTPSTISGICGRLKCCLKYEHDGYQKLAKDMPNRGEYCECPEGKGRITDRNLLTRKLTILLDDSERSVTYSREEIKVLASERKKGK